MNFPHRQRVSGQECKQPPHWDWLLEARVQPEMSEMVTHAKLQYYKHNYSLVCMTGLLGCRWHRYKQSTRDSRKRDLLWFVVFVLTFLFIVCSFYFWLIAKNDYDDLHWHMFQMTKTWIPWYQIMLALVCVSFAYCVVIMILCLIHVLLGHQLYIHPFHVVFIILTLAGCVAVTVTIQNQWSTEWTVVWLSLKMMGPFLQLGAVILMTALSWIISQQWFKLSHWALKVFWLTVFVAVMIGLYISPLYINAPCIISFSQIPPKPKVLAHRGASAIAPENTLLAFRKANENNVYGFESDVMLSLDGVPFLMHDATLRRTTNVQEVFPDRVDEDASMFNMSELKSLDAGSWFLKTDPMGTVGSLTEAEREEIRQQTIPTLEEFVSLANLTDHIIMFDIRPPPASHPMLSQSLNLTVDALEQGGIPRNKVWWLEGTLDQSRPRGVVLVAEEFEPVAELRSENISQVNVQYTEINENQIRLYQDSNISTNIFMVNSRWLFSLYWCVGVETVTTNNCHDLKNMEEPSFYLAPNSYLILWVIVDIISAIIIITFFIVQRVRLFGTKFSPETMSLNTRGSVSRSRTMKQKLLKEAQPDAFEEQEAPTAMGVVNRPSYSMASISGDTYGSGRAHPDARYEVE